MKYQISFKAVLGYSLVVLVMLSAQVLGQQSRPPSVSDRLSNRSSRFCRFPGTERATKPVS